VLAEQTLLPAAARRSKIDLLHNLLNTAPAVPGVPQVSTILDVIYKRYPETHAGVLAWGVALLVPLAARRSRRVITISQSSKADIIEFLGIEAERIDVTPLGPGLAPTKPVPEAELRQRFGLGDAPILLTVSAKRPHKNLVRLIDAIERVRADPPPVLVAPGYHTTFEAAYRRQAGVRVRFTRWLDDNELEGFYRSASCLVFPSLAEGFGLPVLDAMARGLPVACSDATSLPEVAGDAALYFDPTDVDAIARAIEVMLADTCLRERLRHAGPQQAAKFSWIRTADATYESYKRALEEH
jgi:glycosyltransferase involved in cell wall biosynthesis